MSQEKKETPQHNGLAWKGNLGIILGLFVVLLALFRLLETPTPKYVPPLRQRASNPPAKSHPLRNKKHKKEAIEALDNVLRYSLQNSKTPNTKKYEDACGLTIAMLASNFTTLSLKAKNYPGREIVARHWGDTCSDKCSPNCYSGMAQHLEKWRRWIETNL